MLKADVLVRNADGRRSFSAVGRGDFWLSLFKDKGILPIMGILFFEDKGILLFPLVCSAASSSPHFNVSQRVVMFIQLPPEQCWATVPAS